MRQTFSRLDTLLQRSLTAWCALLPAWALLRIVEVMQAADVGGSVLTMLGTMWLNDLRLLCIGFPLWSLMELLIHPLGARLRHGVVVLVGSVLLLTTAALTHYALVAGVPLGADLLAYSAQDIQTTLAGADLGSALPTLTAWLLGWLLWLFLLQRQSRMQTWRVPQGVASALLGLGLVAPWTWSGLAAQSASALPPNKLAHFVGDLLQHPPHANEAQAAFDGAHPFARAETTPDTLSPWLNLQAQKPPHLIILIVEGLGRSFSGPQARLGSFTPFLDELASRSLYWDHFLATQGRTFAVLPSVLGSLPFGPYGQRNIEHDSLPRWLKAQGYTMRYFSGSNLAFDQQGAYLASEGIEVQFSEKDFNRPERRLSEWGYADGDLMALVAQRWPEANRGPSLSVVQTMSMHTPFVVPDQEAYRRRVDERLDALGVPADRRTAYLRQRDIYASILYTDDALRQFFERLSTMPAAANTVVVITGDHRLPEIPMDTRLERYHVPLIIASPLVRQPARFPAISSHFDIAPSLVALLSKQYDWPSPATVSWMGSGLDTHASFRHLHRLPLKQTKTELSDYISGLFYLGQDRLYRLGEGLRQEDVTDEPVAARLRHEFAAVRSALSGLESAERLTPESTAGKVARYQTSPRSLAASHAQHDTELKGIVVNQTQIQWTAPTTVQVESVFTHHERTISEVFVPLLVLTDERGEQVAEASGPALRLAAGESRSVTLTLQLPDRVPRTSAAFAAMIVSHPDTGRAMGRGQYHVALRK